MGLALIATGEHYFFDVLLGWLYAGAVMAAWAWWERRRSTAKATAEPLPASSSAAPLPRASEI
jgi:membrane-associated phospholipid phosphatase